MSGPFSKPSKSTYLSRALESHRSSFTTFHDLLVHIVTWNVNGHFADNLSILFPPSSTSTSSPSSSSSSSADIYIFGFQELDLSPPSLLLPTSPHKQSAWIALLQKHLPKTAVLQSSVQLVGLLLLVFARKPIAHHIAIETQFTGTGILGILGNKGAVAASIKIYDTTLCIVNSHLAADESMVERRNQEVGEIARRIGFGNEQRRIGEHDILIWIGDLNYRVLTKEQTAKQMILDNQLAELFSLDQLNHEKDANRIFQGFKEGKVDFPPTYKFDVGTNRYDTSEKRRVPSWCDRILYRDGDPVTQLSYQSHPELLISDHKPVSSVFQIQVDDIDKQKYAAIHAATIRELDKFENDAMPDGHLSSLIMSMGKITYLEHASQSTELENTGQVTMYWKIIPKLDDVAVCKPWLDIRPSSGMLIPGEKTTITFNVVIGNDCVATFNSSKDTIEDIVVLHIDNGKDYFITIEGTWLPSCYGIRLEELVQLKDPIRSLPSTPSRTSDSLHLSVPKEIWRMLDYLFLYGLTTPGLFLVSGDTKIMETIRHNLSTGTEFDLPKNAVHSMAECFIEFLDALPEPVIPFFATEKCIEAAVTPVAAKIAVQGLPSIHYNVFVYVTSFLREILGASKTDGDGDALNADRLAIIFAAVLIKSEKKGSVAADKLAQRAHQKVEFLKHFLHTPVVDPKSPGESGKNDKSP